VFSFRDFFPQTDCLPWLTSSVYPLLNPGKGDTHGTSGTWSSHKAGRPFRVAIYIYIYQFKLIDFAVRLLYE
jgi:hypothetical protein